VATKDLHSSPDDFKDAEKISPKTNKKIQSPKPYVLADDSIMVRTDLEDSPRKEIDPVADKSPEKSDDYSDDFN